MAARDDFIDGLYTGTEYTQDELLEAIELLEGSTP